MSCYRILIIWDSDNTDSDSITVKNNLDSYVKKNWPLGANDTVEFEYTNLETFDGTNPDPNKFNGVFHVQPYNDDNGFIPTAGQTALTNYVNSGGVYIGTSWMSYRTSFTQYNTNMGNLLIWPQFNSVGNNFSLSRAPYAFETGNRSSINGGADNLTTSLSTSDLKYLAGISTSDFIFDARATDASHNASNNERNLMFIREQTSAVYGAPYLVVKSYGSGLVFGVNDSFDTSGLGGNKMNSSLAYDFVNDGYLKNILKNIDVTLKGDQCLYGICFAGNTLISTDQGQIPISKINPRKHTIENQKILHVTNSINFDDSVVKIEKNAFGKNIPNDDVVVSKDHVFKFGALEYKARELVNEKNIYLIPYNKEKLYNILMKKYNFIKVHNLLAETLHPDNLLSKLVKSKIDKKTKNELILDYNNNIKNNNTKEMISINNFEGKWKVLSSKKEKKLLVNKLYLV